MQLSAKILVTGANGMIGSAIISKLLSEGKKVRAFADKKSENAIEHANLEYVYGDVLDVEQTNDACKGIETIFHCKEMVSFNLSKEDEMYNINVIGTENIVNAAINNKVNKIIYLSSILAFGTYQHKQNITEETKWVQHKENTFYSICKNRAELEIIRGQEEGLETVILNTGLVVGNSSHSQYNIQNIAKANYRFYPKGVNGFIGLEDIVTISLEMLNEKFISEKFILISENSNYQTVLEQLNPKLTNKHLFSRMNGLKIKIIWRINQFRNIVFGATPFLSKEIYNFHEKEFLFSNEKVRKALDFKFTPISKVISDLK